MSIKAWLRCHVLGRDCALPEAHPAQAWQRLAETERLAEETRAEADAVRRQATAPRRRGNFLADTAFPPRVDGLPRAPRHKRRKAAR